MTAARENRILGIAVPHGPFDLVENTINDFLGSSRIRRFHAPDFQEPEPTDENTLAMIGPGNLRTMIQFQDRYMPLLVVTSVPEHFAIRYRAHKTDTQSPAYWYAHSKTEFEYHSMARSLRQDNFQTRWLLGEDALNASTIDLASLSQIVNGLKEMKAFVIPSERLLEGLALLAHRMNWPLPVPSWDPNSHNDSESTIDDSFASEIKKQNPLDQELYNFSLLQFEREMAESGIDAPKRVETMRRLILARQSRAKAD
jgi:hypothetical protein